MPVTALVSRDTDVKPHLNITDAGHDTEIDGFITAATPVIESIIGPVVQRTVTEWYDGRGSSQIALRSRPVVSIGSVTEYRAIVAYTVAPVADPSAATAYSYTLDNNTLTRRNAGGIAMAWPIGVNVVKVVYDVGLSAVPGNVRLAALELIRHWYQQTQQGGRPAAFGSPTYSLDDMTGVSSGYAIPNRVRELLEPNYRIPGFA